MKVVNAQVADLLPLPAPFFQILVALAGGDAHGYAIMREVEERSGGKLRLNPGTLYGSIKRMLELGLIQEARRKSGEDERRRCYRLTDLGETTARAEAERMTETLCYARTNGLATQQI
ncbi:MAG: PadR family transcriptional regulator [Bryobacteraceae bacterium]